MGRQGAVGHRQHQRPARHHRCNLRFDDDEYAEIAAAARAVDLTPAGFLAEAGLAVARNTRLPMESVEREEMRELVRLAELVRRVGTNVNQAVALYHTTGVAPPALLTVAEMTTRVMRQIDMLATQIGRRIQP
ncbi:plasmid mobilization protein [Protofrankia symbiont of Coriaria ruscifolia]|uniref:plasmid mobilization protein n=1 Tax=Protofrankia symbiont of Coriaria ruscifolia TaxID=1306542 RepID=UPI00104119D2|nr:hypothetical protein [Protofrankia symbiont of Coriaria ruscifolia]